MQAARDEAVANRDDISRERDEAVASRDKHREAEAAARELLARALHKMAGMQQQADGLLQHTAQLQAKAMSHKIQIDAEQAALQQELASLRGLKDL